MVDILASEYGWKVDYILHGLPYRRFNKLINAIMDRKREEAERELTNEMYSTYLITETTKQVNAGKKYKATKFKKFLKSVGLGELARKRLKVNKTDAEQVKKKAKENVTDAVKMFSKGGE